jgi:hypothetical protein
MKIKSIIACGLLLLGVEATTTSCEDMLTADNHLVTTDLAPQDTLYQMMGIVKRMQSLADRTILLGEIRADLVDVDQARASADLKALSDNNITTKNKYNSPAEYYGVINSCNIYLTYVDSLYKVYGEYYYQKEIIAAKCFRAWCYLELAKIYGSVPFITEPVLSAEAAEQIVASGNKKSMLEILDFAIQDLAPYAYLPENSNLRPSYGATFSGVSARIIFLPVRALLGELYLWRGSVKGKGAGQSDFIDAVRMYHDYLCYPGEEKSVDYNSIEWTSTNWQSPIRSGMTSTYSLYNFGLGSQNAYAAVLPLDTAAYYGTTSDLRAIFNSNYSNNYYPSVVPSTRMGDISKAQKNLFISWKKVTTSSGAQAAELVRSYAPENVATLGDERLIGDLRFADVYRTESNVGESRYNANRNSVKQYITKWLEGSSSISDDKRQTYIIYYRTNTLYLHMAEALNLAGFPETAFVVLSRGLTYGTLNTDTIRVNQTITKTDGSTKDTIIAMKLVSDDEFDRLCNIKTYGYTNTTSDYDTDKAKAEKAANSFVVWKRDVFWNLPKLDNNRSGSTIGSWRNNTAAPQNAKTQIGLHSLGSGDSEFNEFYQLDDKATRDQLKQGLKPDLPEGGYPSETGVVLTFDEWKAITTKAKTTTNYDAYVDEYNQYPTKLANYNADVTFLKSAAVRAKRQAHISWLILEEEALEGAFEGQRFYDILRYQMQEGKVSGPSATIQMPDSITKLYGPTPNMTGKPWYLPLPNR